MKLPAHVPPPVRDFCDETGSRSLSDEDRERLKRLVSHPEMKKAYAALEGVLADAGEWRDFIDAVWGAQIDYGARRKRWRETMAANEEIVEAARWLAFLLREVVKKSPAGVPAELFNVRTLLRATSPPDADSRAMWQVMREKLVGDDVVYAWSKAPTLDLLLDTVATAAHGFGPHEVDQFAAAIGTRQKNPKTEYVRALMFLLQERGFSFTRQIITAVAAAATAALDDPDGSVVTPDDVRKLLPAVDQK